MNKFFNFMFSLCVFLAILLQSAQFYVFNENYYLNQYKNTNLYHNKYIQSEINFVTHDIIKYINNKSSNLSKNYSYTNKEIFHMKDVKNIFLNAIKVKNFIILICIIYFIININNYKIILNNLKNNLIYINICFILMAIIIYFNYEKIFFAFHNIAFKNDYWILNPKESIIINLFPLNFFKNISMHIIITTLLINIVIITLLHVSKKVKPGA